LNFLTYRCSREKEREEKEGGPSEGEVGAAEQNENAQSLQFAEKEGGKREGGSQKALAGVLIFLASRRADRRRKKRREEEGTQRGELVGFLTYHFILTPKGCWRCRREEGKKKGGKKKKKGEERQRNTRSGSPFLLHFDNEKKGRERGRSRGGEETAHLFVNVTIEGRCNA